ncbi:GGDEF domain-containing protein [Vibrio sp. B1FLJ16]|uniref:GGDEF domain-containing protein n=1 Tax=Vibrio sp. B1FLJ16 TaxID=2751178 RepID=UPI0015F3CA41|nr:GGDEF domain-containing protein [Vibrio sp. B1FLJ16]CAD7823293.1 COG2199 FOG GGDEF domain [Vibrio sp. B1FLJ16]CAE6951514.1 COG2199 FOG GGDEF domain [Vibrio sp. B1FLJ16]
MSTLAGARLKEMADIGSTRKKKIVFLCSSIAATCLVYGAVIQSFEQHWSLCLIYSLSAVACLSICYMIKVQKHHQYADLLFSAILMLDGLFLLLFNDTLSGTILWLYPILVALILINEFKVGLIFSCSYLIFIFISIVFLDKLPIDSPMVERRFLLTLLAISFVCHTFSYYYAKILNYVQILYREGIEELAYFDQLTGLANRWSFETWVQQKLDDIDHSHDSALTALVFLDLDNFKHINDNYGHDVGDQVLKTFASRLQSSVRNRDRSTLKHDYSIARFAGDEFVLLLYDVHNKEDLNKVLQRIVNVYAGGHQEDSMIHEITMSLGVAIYKQDAAELSELVRCADKAMYVAKQTGKNQYAYYEDCIEAEELSNPQVVPPNITQANEH